MLQIKDLTFGYKKNEPVLKNISLSLSPGITLLVGENGSGKSTLMHCLTGMLHVRVKSRWKAFLAAVLTTRVCCRICRSGLMYTPL